MWNIVNGDEIKPLAFGNIRPEIYFVHVLESINTFSPFQGTTKNLENMVEPDPYLDSCFTITKKFPVEESFLVYS